MNSIQEIHRTVHQQTADWATCMLAAVH